ncbi:MAG: hypothetical protein GEU77_09880 [Deltaproteobacteria bacterium]|nr:hypothetical protein [Deltaproteobacteria bacterium]
MRIRRILAPTDLSINSISGIACALSLSRDHDAEIILFHVTSFPKPPLSSLCEAECFPFGDPVFLPPSVDRVLQEADARLNAFVSASLGDILAEYRRRTHVSLGPVSREIVNAALSEQVDLIVMAKRRRGFLPRLFSPSISEQVSRSAPCPVLSVCPPQIARPTEGKQRSDIKGILRSVEA